MEHWLFRKNGLIGSVVERLLFLNKRTRMGHKIKFFSSLRDFNCVQMSQLQENSHTHIQWHTHAHSHVRTYRTSFQAHSHTCTHKKYQGTCSQYPLLPHIKALDNILSTLMLHSFKISQQRSDFASHWHKNPFWIQPFTSQWTFSKSSVCVWGGGERGWGCMWVHVWVRVQSNWRHKGSWQFLFQNKDCLKRANLKTK